MESQKFCELRILVPSDSVGAIVGLRGGTIGRISHETGARIELPPKYDDRPSRKVVTIRGNPNECTASCRKILEAMRKADGRGADESVLQILVENRFVGSVIGLKNIMLNRIMNETDTCITVSRKNNKNNVGPDYDRVVTVTGRIGNVSRAEAKISERIRIRVETEAPAKLIRPTTLRSYSSVTLKLSVPSDQIGRIIGFGGRSIRDIQKTTGCFVKLPCRGSTGEEQATTTVLIVGNDSQATRSARQQILSLITSTDGGKNESPVIGQTIESIVEQITADDVNLQAEDVLQTPLVQDDAERVVKPVHLETITSIVEQTTGVDVTLQAEEVLQMPLVQDDAERVVEPVHNETITSIVEQTTGVHVTLQAEEVLQKPLVQDDAERVVEPVHNDGTVFDCTTGNEEEVADEKKIRCKKQIKIVGNVPLSLTDVLCLKIVSDARQPIMYFCLNGIFSIKSITSKQLYRTNPPTYPLLWKYVLTKCWVIC